MADGSYLNHIVCNRQKTTHTHTYKHTHDKPHVIERAVNWQFLLTSVKDIVKPDGFIAALNRQNSHHVTRVGRHSCTEGSQNELVMD